MESLVYYSRNRKSPPFEVTVRFNGRIVHIDCNCELGVERKICRHKINAIRGDKDNCHAYTTDETIKRLRREFNTHSTLRLHLEEKWRAIREFASQFPNDEQAISNKRRILGEALSDGFCNESVYPSQEPFDLDAWEEQRDTISSNLSIPATLTYINYDGETTRRSVVVNEVFSQGAALYLMAHCELRGQPRTFRVDRIHGVEFGGETTPSDKSSLLDVILQGCR